MWLDLRSGAGAIAAQAMDRARARIRSGRCGLRVIATSRAEVEQWLGRIPDEALVVEVPNVRDRRAAIPRLFAEAMARRECPLELDDLGEANARALLDHDWPGNRDEIATVAAHLAQAVKDPSRAEIALDALKGYGVVFDPRDGNRFNLLSIIGED